ncbi:ABC superfamily ATP binding cassette transporter, ABC protein [Limosilactobacillus frumenti DSM 13145]|uniref:ABC superfamily ATP binding cassette transporter, ABC protein n=1 Tax=Limosilactobacillus frumenti DSM 13145 TaxID=1423746 RepID=A0A0R1PF61_9LACO|nr:ABC-F family ATP-binding cassette domain-containing protein [Limosilactobacillus frumenti]KRL27064.1 ABC superfamily ATP binding cassette transporter, ABC protein [Limosilactobacillus frumenti DSM 13145]MBA2914241.1 ABC-F family ATP-binding cassette domain-containing protein [Limosilactobacillus frumenti]QFG72536.1 ABC-F family ATP-binding cassette domain-containing protein [Limosilactobacillus frumenti]
MQTMRAEGLTSTYGEKVLFDHVSFIINENDRIGLIGVNGSGKTSLLNVISGAVSPESGTITCPNDYRIGYLKQQPELDPDKTIMDAVFAGDQEIFKLIRQYELALDRFSNHPDDPEAVDRYTKLQAQMDQADAWEADSQVKTILTQLKIKNVSQKIGNLSGGQQKRVGLAQVLIQQPDLLLLDEPTNHLDLDSIIWLQDFLASYKGAVLVVTHDRYFLDQVTNHIWELSFGKLYHYDGNYQDFVRQKAERVELAKESERKNQQLYKKELAWMRTGAKARSTKQKGRINRFHKLEKQVGNLQTDEDISINLGSQRLGKDVIQFKDANLTLGDHRILKDFNWLVKANDRIGITGENGAGKTSLLNVIAQRVPLDSGVLKIGDTVKLGYYTQQTEGIDDSKRMISFLTEIADNVTDKDGNKISVTQLLERFLFPRFMHGTLIRKLSGGEKRRLYLLKILMQQPNVLLLDEPTNDLDIGTLTVLEDYLDHFAGTVITVSHDRYFLDKVADDLLIFKGDGDIQRYTGLFTDYLKEQQQLRAEKEDEKADKKSSKSSAAHEPKKKVKTKLTYAEEIEWKQINQDLDKLDQSQKQIEQDMADSADDYQKLAELQKKLDQVKQQLDEKTARWEYLSNYVE